MRKLEHILKIFPILCILAIFNLACHVYAQGPFSQLFSGQENAVVPDECAFASGNDFGYNGDQTSGDTYGCLSGSAVNGAESAGGIVTANGCSGNGVEVNAANEFLKFTTTQDYSHFHYLGKIKFTTITGFNSFFETRVDDNNRLFIYGDTNGNIYYRWTGNGINVTGNHTKQVSANTCVIVDFEVDTNNSFNGATSGIRVRIDLNADGDFDDANEGYTYEGDADAVTAMTSNPTTFVFGEEAASQGPTDVTIVDDTFLNW